jgi:hypothetical protein
MSKGYFIKYIKSLIELFSGNYVVKKEGLYHHLVICTQTLIKDCNISEGDKNDNINVLFTNDINTIKRILKNIKSLKDELRERMYDGFVSLKESIANENAKLDASTYDLLLKFTIDLGITLSVMIERLKITISNEETKKEDNIREFIISQIKANKNNLTTELNALQNNKLFIDIKIDKYMSDIPTDNISNFINYRINNCHLFTMFINNNTFENNKKELHFCSANKDHVSYSESVRKDFWTWKEKATYQRS